MTTLTDYTVFNDIQLRLEKITAEEVELSASRLEKATKGEKVIGKIEEGTKRLWALLCLMCTKYDIAKAKSEQLLPSSLLKEFVERATIADEFCKLISAIAWTQARSDCGFWEPKSIGIREGWLLVELSDPLEDLANFINNLCY